MRISKSVNLYLGELYLCYGRHYRKSVLCRAAKEHGQDSAEPGKDFAMRNHTAQLRSAKVLCRELFTNRTAKVLPCALRALHGTQLSEYGNPDICRVPDLSRGIYLCRVRRAKAARQRSVRTGKTHFPVVRGCFGSQTPSE